MLTSVWATIGLVAVLSELLLGFGSFFFLFLGISALLVAGARLCGLDNLIVEIILFVLFSLGSIFLFRKKLLASLRARSHFRIDNKLELDCEIPAHETRSVSYQGSKWTAVNMSGHTLKAGETVQIVKIEGVKLFLNSIHN